MTKTAKLYGDSLYDLAETPAEKEAYLNELQCVCSLFSENPDYPRLLQEPSVPLKERLKLLDDAFGSASQYVLNFLKLLLEEGLLSEISGCARQVKERYNEEFGIAEAVVTTAVKLDREEEEKLKATLSKRFKKKIVLIEKVDPQVLGGVLVEIEGIQLDKTVRSSLARLHEAIKK